jgi:hypothetical protein
MDWKFVIALIIAIPVIIFPAVFIWYTNLGGMYQAIKKAWQRRATSEKKVGQALDVEGNVSANRYPGNN